MARAAARQQHPEGGVDRAGSRDALDGLDARRHRCVALEHGGEVVGVDAEHDDGADELDAAEDPLETLEARGP